MSKKHRQKNSHSEQPEIQTMEDQKPFLSRKTIALLLFVSIIANIGFIYHVSTHKDIIIEKYEQYKFLSKRVFLENPNDIILNFVPLRKALREYISFQNGKVGVYFEYLPSGISIGVNDREEVQLASLSKVPLAMAVLKKIEKGGMSLEKKIILKKEHLDSKFGTLWKAGEGATFTVEELLEKMLIESDNTAYEALFSELTSQEIVEVYENLEIEVTSKDTNPLVSPKSYSSIFRSLYLASYLSKEDSNKILEILTKTAFHDKIPSGVPKEVPVSHKIGVFSTISREGEVFTDCGIVYFPSRPYILCIFSQGSDAEAQNHMGVISKMIYGYVSFVKGGN